MKRLFADWVRPIAVITALARLWGVVYNAASRYCRGMDYVQLVGSISIADVERLAERAWRDIPKRMRDACGDVVIRVVDYPDGETLQDMDADPYDLLGLYSGVSLRDKSVYDIGNGIDMIFLYRRPILRYWTERPESLEHLVRHVLVHEIGHHLGLSDDDMERIEMEAGS